MVFTQMFVYVMLTADNSKRKQEKFKTILYPKFKMSNHKIVFLSRVVVILPGISLGK